MDKSLSLSSSRKRDVKGLIQIYAIKLIKDNRIVLTLNHNRRLRKDTLEDYRKILERQYKHEIDFNYAEC